MPFGLEKYPSGRRGSPAKGVVLDNGSESSNLSFSAKTLENIRFSGVFLFAIMWQKVALRGAELMSTTDTTTDIIH